MKIKGQMRKLLQYNVAIIRKLRFQPIYNCAQIWTNEKIESEWKNTCQRLLTISIMQMIGRWTVNCMNYNNFINRISISSYDLVLEYFYLAIPKRCAQLFKWLSIGFVLPRSRRINKQKELVEDVLLWIRNFIRHL